MDSKPKPICVCAGNIGAGKSTLLSSIEQMLKIQNGEENKENQNNKASQNIKVVLEPVGKWTERKMNEDGTSEDSILEMFYKDPKRYAFCFQMYALQTRFVQLTKTIKENPSATLLYERCPLSDYNIFAKLLHKTQKITSQEYHIYKEWFDMVYDMINPNIKAIIYLDVPVDICHKRIAKRNRQGEANISMDYLRDLEEMHQLWLEDPALIDKNIRLYKVEFMKNDNGEFDYDHVDFDKLMTFIQSVN